MAKPLKHIPVKLIVGFISSKPSQFISARHILEKKFGKIDKETPLLDFSRTHYYEREFGKNLERKFLSFKNLIPLKKNYAIKLYTNKIEKKLSENNARTLGGERPKGVPSVVEGRPKGTLSEVEGRPKGVLSETNVRPKGTLSEVEGRSRTINIDPGYISLAKLVLFTTKNRSHRIYIDKGIYGDLELQFIKKSFQPLQWTYPDYRTQGYIDFFNSVRAIYLNQIKNICKIKNAA